MLLVSIIRVDTLCSTLVPKKRITDLIIIFVVILRPWDCVCMLFVVFAETAKKDTKIMFLIVCDVPLSKDLESRIVRK